MSEEFKYFDPSPVANDYFTHFEALKPCDGLNVGKSYPLAKEGLKEGFLRETLKDVSKGGKVFAMIVHDTVFEILRLPDGASVNRFYSLVETPNTSNKEAEELQQKKAVELACIQYLRSNWFDVANYCIGNGLKQAFENRVIPHAYLQRKLASVSIFRRSSKGSTKALMDAIDSLVGDNVLKKLSATETMGSFKTKSQCFRYLPPVAPMA